MPYRYSQLNRINRLRIACLEFYDVPLYVRLPESQIATIRKELREVNVVDAYYRAALSERVQFISACRDPLENETESKPSYLFGGQKALVNSIPHMERRIDFLREPFLHYAQ